MDVHVALSISDSSHTGEARRFASNLASQLGFDSFDAGRVALVVTEAATNILKHARKGEILLRPIPNEAGGGIEILALDRGPGIADVQRAMQDGYSTAGSPGTGLGAMSRIASSIEAYSRPGVGTAWLVRVLPQGANERPAPGPLRVGAVQVAAPGEVECGDDWSIAQRDGRSVLLVADGLGHGPAAAQAAAEAARTFQIASALPIDQILRAMHRALVETRGAAVSVAEVDLGAGEVRFAGVGNVAGLLAWAGGSRGMVTQNGIVGGQFGTIRVGSYPWMPGSTLIMYTDGLTTHVNVQSYPGLLGCDPSLVAAVLYRDFRRGRDDATVIVARDGIA